MSSTSTPPTTDVDATRSPAEVAETRKRTQTIAYAAGAFLAIGLGLPIGFALRDWKIGLAVAVIVGLLTIVGYLKAGADHAERRAARVAHEHSLSDDDLDDDEENDNGAYR